MNALKHRNFGLTVRKEKRGFLKPPIYYIEMFDGANKIEVREESGFRIKTQVKFPKNILFE